MEIEPVQRKAGLRYISGYRTFLAPAIKMLAEIPLLGVKIAEIAEAYKAMKESHIYTARKEASEKPCQTKCDEEMCEDVI